MAIYTQKAYFYAITPSTSQRSAARQHGKIREYHFSFEAFTFEKQEQKS